MASSAINDMALRVERAHRSALRLSAWLDDPSNAESDDREWAHRAMCKARARARRCHRAALRIEAALYGETQTIRDALARIEGPSIYGGR